MSKGSKRLATKRKPSHTPRPTPNPTPTWQRIITTLGYVDLAIRFGEHAITLLGQVMAMLSR